MASIGTLAVSVVAHTAKYVAGMREAATSTGMLRKSVGVLATGGKMAFGILAAAGGLVAAQTLRSAAAMDAVAKQADRLALSTEGYVSLAHGAGLAGVEIGELEGSLDRSNKFIGELAKGNKSAAKTLQMLGINARQFMAVPYEQKLGLISDGLAGVKDAGLRASLGTAIFGRSGAALTQFLSSGRQALRESYEDAKALGLVFSRMDAAKVEKMNDAMTRLWSSFKGFGNKVAISVAEPVARILNNAANWVGKIANNPKLEAMIDKVVTTLLMGVGSVWDVLVNIIPVIFSAGDLFWKQTMFNVTRVQRMIYNVLDDVDHWFTMLQIRFLRMASEVAKKFAKYLPEGTSDDLKKMYDALWVDMAIGEPEREKKRAGRDQDVEQAKNAMNIAGQSARGMVEAMFGGATGIWLEKFWTEAKSKVLEPAAKMVQGITPDTYKNRIKMQEAAAMAWAKSTIPYNAKWAGSENARRKRDAKRYGYGSDWDRPKMAKATNNTGSTVRAGVIENIGQVSIAALSMSGGKVAESQLSEARQQTRVLRQIERKTSNVGVFA